ncbi:flagellar hook protein FlgE [Pseudoalteromonas sp. A25]|uniref:flagellar hook protein FlgE n=1 Tax=Pseudoalteromonas sp. A25 TaxID=116092 RepID=UPI00126098DE|nr:flagellar hook protein FlgE [Pseudoalteromonas sp. A25]BBN81067.1 flagellar hook protein FlgE [Pseudoalteromonas sp. A25]
MSFNIALTGLAAAQKDLDTTANNIANVNTTGFKESRAEFSDVYAASVFSAGATKNGDGAQTTMVAQQFHQGSLKFTQNSLDLAITGEGYFATSEDLSSQDYAYTRAGAFKLNKDNFIVDSKGNFLQGFPVDASTGDTTSVSLSTSTALQIPDASGSPRATNNVYTSFNLDSRQSVPTLAFDPNQSASYNASTSTTVYDSLGEPHVMQFFFRKTADNDWSVYATLDGVQFNHQGDKVEPTATPAVPSTPISMFRFDSSGLPSGTAADPTATPVVYNAVPAGTTFGALTIPGVPGTAPVTPGLSELLGNGATFPNDVIVNWRDEANTTNKLPTQYASRFEVKALEQDGATVGRLAGIDIGSDGKIVASYSNGDSTFLGQVAMVRFSNSQGLQQVGNTSWKKSLTSGEPIAGEPGSGTLGTINSSALEQSNVNLTNELVDLISAQRNFQANSRALEVNSTIQQNILQIR